MKIKLLNNLSVPKKQREGDAGFDLYSPVDFVLMAKTWKQVKLGYQIELPKDSFGLVVERSGHALKFGVSSIGPIIDENYRGEISAILYNAGEETQYFKQGERVAQLLVLPLHQDQTIEVVDELSTTGRGDQNHGSSGR